MSFKKPLVFLFLPIFSSSPLSSTPLHTQSFFNTISYFSFLGRFPPQVPYSIFNSEICLACSTHN